MISELLLVETYRLRLHGKQTLAKLILRRQFTRYNFLMGLSDEALLAKRDALMLRDATLIEQLKKYDVDLDKSRVIDLSFWAPSETAAKKFAEACKRNEMPPEKVLGPAASQGSQHWLIQCPFAGSPHFVTTKDNVVTFLLFADKYDCEYDGWGTAIVEAAAPKIQTQ